MWQKPETFRRLLLFVRSPRGTRLTPEGEKLYAHVKVAVEHIQAGEKEIASAQCCRRRTGAYADCLKLLCPKSVHENSFEPGRDFVPAMDAASSEWKGSVKDEYIL